MSLFVNKYKNRNNRFLTYTLSYWSWERVQTYKQKAPKMTTRERNKITEMKEGFICNVN